MARRRNGRELGEAEEYVADSGDVYVSRSLEVEAGRARTRRIGTAPSMPRDPDDWPVVRLSGRKSTWHKGE